MSSQLDQGQVGSEKPDVSVDPNRPSGIPGLDYDLQKLREKAAQKADLAVKEAVTRTRAQIGRNPGDFAW